MNLSFLQHPRVRPILSGSAIVIALSALLLLCGRPSSVKESSRLATIGEDGELAPGAPGEVVVPEGEAETGGSKKRGSSRGKSLVGSVKVGSGAAPLTEGIGRGITESTINLGFMIVENNQKVLSNYGVQGGAIGDTQEQVDAIVEDLNDRGGILGRKVVAITKVLDAAATDDPLPPICTAFTQDERVFAVLSPWNTSPDFHACLAKGGVIYMTDALDQEDAETFDQLQPYVVSGVMNSTRSALTLATALKNGGFFAPGTLLGVVRKNSPSGERVYKQHLIPALASFGVTPTAVGTSDPGGAVVGNFNEKGINRVMFITARGGPPLFFMGHAQSQGYFPLYGLASPDGPSFLAQNAPFTQMRGAMGAGWNPGLDVLDSEGPPFSATEQRCLDVHSKGGTDYGTRTEGAAPAMMFCDLLWLFEETANKAGRTLNVASFATEFIKLGTSHASAVTFNTNFAPGIFDGASHYRPFAYDDSPTCRCFRYTGGKQLAAR